MTKTRSTVYLYTSFPPPPFSAGPQLSVCPIYGPNRCFHELWRLNIDPISLSWFIWQLNSNATIYICERWERTNEPNQTVKAFCPFSNQKFSVTERTRFEWQTNQEMQDIVLLEGNTCPMLMTLKFGAKIEPHVEPSALSITKFNIKLREKNGFNRILERKQLRVVKYNHWDNHKVGWGLKKWKLVARRTTQNVSTDLTSQIKQFLTGYFPRNQSNGNRVPLVTFRMTRKCKLVGKNV